MAELVCRADDPRWLELRRSGVTATDLPAILGLSRYDSLYSAYWRKVAGIEDQAENDRLALGRYMEPYVLSAWEEARQRPLTPGGLYRSGDRPWQLATPDALVRGEPVEGKSWGTLDGWGDDGSDLIPLQVRAQVLWQMDTLSASTGHVGVVFLPSGEFRSYRLAHDPAVPLGYDVTHTLPGELCTMCGDILAMRAAAAEFWQRVQERDVPPPDGSPASLAALKSRFAVVGDTTAEIEEELFLNWDNARHAEARAKAARKALEAEMREQGQHARLYAVDGEVFARREVFTAHVKAHDRTTDRLMPVKPRQEKTDE